METVQIVIKISKKDYEDIECQIADTVQEWRLKQAVREGTVISKGHWMQQPRCEGDEQPDLVCPNCGFKISWWDMGNFCAKCGKGLEGGAE